jgi:hypothetical protein
MPPRRWPADRVSRFGERGSLTRDPCLLTALVAGPAFIAEQSRRLTAARIAAGTALIAGLAFVAEKPGGVVVAVMAALVAGLSLVSALARRLPAGRGACD